METRDEIRYCDVLPNADYILRNFPVISAYGPDDSHELLQLYQFDTPNGHNYAILGKFLPGRYPSSHDFTYLNWIYHLQKLLSGNNAGEKTYAEFLKELTYVKQSEEMNKLLFTQEGYDLINGKFFFQKDGLVQRTVKLETTRVNDEILFGTNYKATNKEAKMDHIGLFAPWGEYDESYFLNQKDIAELIPGETALLYAVINKDRLFEYVDKHHSVWGRKHNLEEHKTAPDDVADYALQLIDVVTNLQVEESNRKNKVVSTPINPQPDIRKN